MASLHSSGVNYVSPSPQSFSSDQLHDISVYDYMTWDEVSNKWNENIVIALYSMWRCLRILEFEKCNL